MGSRILLINANRCVHPDPVFPLGLAYVAAALRGAGHECFWLDSLAGEKNFSQQLASSKADFVGISVRNIDDVLIRRKETFYEDITDLVQLVHERLSCKVILGGSGFSIFPERLLELTHADFGVTGEAEQAMVELIAALETGERVENIAGVVYWRDGHPIANRADAALRPQKANRPERPEELASFYLNTGSMLNIQTQRGCAFRCCYCTYPVIEGRQHRRQPPEAIAEEFERVARAGGRYAFIVDSVFNSSPRHVVETCEALIRVENKLPWGCFLRPQGLTSEQLNLLARAGLAHIEFGSDSFSDEVLAAYQKDFRFEDILRAGQLARDAKIDFCHFLISGGPGETYDTLEEGFANSRHIEGGVIMAVVGMRVYPGTQLCERALAEKKISAATDLLQPFYYVSDQVTAEGVFQRLREFSAHSPNWIVGDPDPAYQNLVKRLRARGVAGPLWSYFSMIQRLWPQRLGTVEATTG